MLHQFIHRHDGEENKSTIKYVSLGHNSLSFKNVLFICDSLCKGPFVSEYVFLCTFSFPGGQHSLILSPLYHLCMEKEALCFMKPLQML